MRRRRRTFRIDLTPKSALVAVLALASVWLALQLWPVVLAVVGALMFVGTLNPIVEALERRKIRRTVAVIGIFVTVFVVLGVFAVLTFPTLVAQMSDVGKRVPELQRDVAAKLDHAGSFGAQLAARVRAARGDEQHVTELGKAILAYTPRAFEILAWLLSSVFLALYFMLDRDRLRGAFFAAFPRSKHVRLARILLELETIVGGYMRGQVITCALAGAFTFVVLAIAGVPNAIAFAAFAAVADLLPYVGALLACGPAFVAALQRGPTIAIVVLVLLAAYQEFESRVIVPRVYGRVLRLPSFVVMLSLIIGGKLLGVLGALLALPVAAALRMLALEYRAALPGEDVDESADRMREAKEQAELERRAAGAPAAKSAAVATEIAEQTRTVADDDQRGIASLTPRRSSP